MPRPLFDSEYIYGLHDPGGEHLMIEESAPGWVLVTKGIGSDPNNGSGDDFTGLSSRNLGVIVRLNNGYRPNGTIPRQDQYQDFAKRCARYVQASSGCRIWIIGNETNHEQERPNGEFITAEMYARCYQLCRTEIRKVDPLAQVLIGAVAPWNNTTKYAGNDNGDWIKYFADILNRVGSGNCDGITLHTYSRGSDPNTITNSDKMDAPFSNYSKQFRTYRDFMAVVPSSMRGLPCYITETDQDEAWVDKNTGWVRAAYDEINNWNQQPGNQVIRALILYRWSRDDKWQIDGKNGVIEDFRQALGKRYKWPERTVDPLADLRQRLANLEAAINKLWQDLQKVPAAARAVENLRGTMDALTRQLAGATTLGTDIDALRRAVGDLEQRAALPGGWKPTVPTPTMIDKRSQLPRNGTTNFPTRPTDAIRQIIIHHTAIADDSVPPERIAQAQVSKGKAGITYHFLINGSGDIYWLQDLTVSVEQTLKDDANQTSIGIALGGNFMAAAPSDAQLNAAANLVAWLVATYQISTNSVVGRNEVERVGSPGSQWLNGAKYKETLLTKVQAILSTAAPTPAPPDEGQLAELRKRLDAAEGQVAKIRAAVDQLLSGGNLPPSPVGGVPKPDIQAPGELAKHPTIQYETRALNEIQRIIVHHTVTSDNVAPNRIAQAQVAQGKAGITYHFVIMGSGVIYGTQPLETVTEQTTQPPLDQTSVGVALAGNFTSAPPQPAQLNAAAKLIAWLLATLKLSPDAVVGRSEIERVGSPGAQWMTGAKYKNTLIDAVRQALAAGGGIPATGAPDDNNGEIGDDADAIDPTGRLNALQAELATALAQVAKRDEEIKHLQEISDQVGLIETHVRELEAALNAREAEVASLQAQLAQANNAPVRGRVERPAIQDIVDKLPTNSNVDPYPTRSASEITKLVVHHTATPKTITPRNVADAQIRDNECGEPTSQEITTTTKTS